MTTLLGRHRAKLTILRPDASALLALAAGIIAISWYGFATESFLARLDTVTQYIPWYTYLGERLRAGDIPGWLPYSLSGAPFTGDPQSGWGYLPVMLIFTLFSGRTGFEILIVFHLTLAAAASYAFARVVGLGVAGSTVAAAAFAFSGMVERARCCTIHVEVAVWVPVALLGIELGARAETWERRFAAWGLTGIAASQMIAGWIGQGAAYGLLTIAAYAGYRIAIAPDTVDREPRTRLIRLAWFAATVSIVSGTLSATALVPRVDVVDRSNLAGGSYELVQGDASVTSAWGVWELIDRLLSQDDRAGRFYAGAAVLALAVLAPLLARLRFRVAFFVPFSMVVLILTLHQTLIHRLFYLVPAFQRLHEHRPERVLTVFPLAPAILAGATVTVLSEKPGRTRWMAAIAIVPIAAILAVQTFMPESEPELPTTTMLPVAIVSIAVAVLLMRPDPRAMAASLLLLIAVVFWDPSLREVVTNQRTLPANAAPSVVGAYDSPNGIARFLQERRAAEGPFRFAGYDPALLVWQGEVRTYHVRYSDPATLALLVNNRGIALGLEDVQGYNPIQIQRYVEFMTALNGETQSYHAANVLFRGGTSPLLNLLNVRYLIVPRTVPPGRPDLLHLNQRYPTVYLDDDVRVLERTDALPRVWIVHEIVTAESDAEALNLLASEQFDPTRTAVLPAEVGSPPMETPPVGAAEVATLTKWEPDQIEVTATMAAPGMLMLSEIWDTGWRVLVDGKPATLYRVDATLRGVALERGEHAISLEYAPGRLIVSAIGSGFAWLVVMSAYLVWLARWLIRRHRNRPLDPRFPEWAQPGHRYARHSPGAIPTPPPGREPPTTVP